MTAEDVLEVLDALARADVRPWLDGGWAIDALVGEQTREHADLDLALDAAVVAAAVEALRALGYSEDPDATPGLPARVVLTDAEGRHIDLHPLVFDDDGNGWQQLSASGRAWGLYPAADLRATGIVGGRRVPCTSAELQHRFRMGYEWSDRDEHAMRVLSERLGLPAPPDAPGTPR